MASLVRRSGFLGSGSAFLLLGFTQASSQQKDPVNDFCRRFGHQTAVIDRRLYIDGGLVNWNPISENKDNVTNTWLLYNDLNTSPLGVGEPLLYANLSKNSTIPNTNGGILWADDVNKRFFLYGGDYNVGEPSSFELFSYDTLFNNWGSLGSPNSIKSVAYGGGVSVSNIGRGFMYGGWMSNKSVPGWIGEPLATTGLIEYEYDTGVWRNNSEYEIKTSFISPLPSRRGHEKNGPDDVPRAEGTMIYVPASVSGLLIYFGGISTSREHNTTTAAPMTIIHIYDIQSSKWYEQMATGDIPPSRRRFCAGAAWPGDQSSYNIYLYGGLGFGENATGFDDVYILSMPTFQWLKWWPTEPGTASPHHSLSCDVIDGSQMLIIGGSFPTTDRCDSPFGTHSLNLGKQNSGGAKWFTYQPNLTTYQVPDEIVSIVGGEASGGATRTSPSAGFNNRDLSVYFAQQANPAARTATRAVSIDSVQSTTLSAGAIAGIAVGSTAALLVALLGAFCLYRRRKRKSPDQQHAQAPRLSPQMSYQEYPYSPQSQPSAPHSPQVTEYQQLPASPDEGIPVELAGTEAKTPIYRHASATTSPLHSSSVIDMPELAYPPMSQNSPPYHASRLD